MANTTSPRSSIYTGVFYNAVDGRLETYYRGTKVTHVNATELQVDQALDANGNITFSGTLAPDSLPPAVTGDTSTYQETAISLTLDALATIGLLTDSTTT